MQVSISKLKIRAHTTSETFERMRAKRSVTGRIFVEVDGFCFPERDWDDFMIDVLVGWMDNAVLLGRHVVEVDNRFMDGPLSVRISRDIGSDALAVTLYRNDEPFVPQVFHVDLRRYVAELRGAAKSVLGELRKGGEGSAHETVALEHQLKKLAGFEASLAKNPRLEPVDSKRRKPGCK